MSDGVFWKSSYSGQLESDLSGQEKALRDLFVDEYLVDYQRRNAAIRCGFQEPFAEQYATQFMQEPYVLKRISERQALGISEDEEEAHLAQMRRRVEEALIKQANYSGPGSSHGARVAALSKLVNIYGMEKASKVEQEITHRGGVMAVPGIAGIDEWQDQALKNQAKLMGEAEA